MIFNNFYFEKERYFRRNLDQAEIIFVDKNAKRKKHCVRARARLPEESSPSVIGIQTTGSQAAMVSTNALKSSK